MKKKILMCLCAVCFILPIAFMLAGCNNKTETYNVNFDYGKATSFFETNITSVSVNSNEWVTTIPKIKDAYKDSFLGWFVKGSDTEIKNNSFIGADCTLEARFDINEAPSGLYQNGKYEMTWEEVKSCTSKTDLVGELVLDSSFFNEDFSNCDKITQVIIPINLKAIHNNAFEGCTSLTKIVIPQNIIGIYGSAFKNCTNIKSVIINGDIKTSSINGVFDGCSSLEYITISEGVRYLGNLFGGCNNVKSINLPSTLEYIDDFAFRNCSSLSEIYIPSNVWHVGEGVFGGCDSLTNIYVSKFNETFIGTGTDSSNRSILINKETKTIVSGQLFYAGHITYNGIIGERAFNKNNNLSKLTVSANKIGKLAFYECENLTEVEIYSNVTEISSSAFYGCNLEKFTLNNAEGYKWQISIDEENNTWVDVSALDNVGLIGYLTTETHCCLKQVEI
ncbi:MAG: leucine-rich repeat domain-containing protein [Candidatus Caccovivens sp.]